MVEINYSKLKENCSYCFQGTREGIIVCECSLSFCREHLNIHRNKTECKELFLVEKKEIVTVTGGSLTVEEKKRISKRFEVLNNCKGERKVVLKEGEVECPHLKEREGRIQLGTLEGVQCMDCQLKKNLYVCLSCGFMGCGRVQFGTEGNGHAMEHYKSTGHEVFVLVQSITPEYTCDTYCYTCNDFVMNPFCDTFLSFIGNSEGSSIGSNKECNDTIQSTPVVPHSTLVGIVNAGNTCYISSTLQLYGYIIKKGDFKSTDHFLLCEYQNPLDCFYCQTVRVLNGLQTERDPLSIGDLLNLIWSQMPLFTKDTQHDANEFLMFFTQLLREGEERGVLPSITPSFSFELENSIWCENCKKNVVRMETHCMLYLPFERDVQSSLESYFTPSKAKCDCGGEMLISNRICSLPEYLIVTIGRGTFKDGVPLKITQGIGEDHVDLSSFLRKTKLSNFFFENLLLKDFTDAEINLALSGNNFEDLEGRIKEYKGLHRTKAMYNVGGAVVHSGNSMDSGHYMWWVKESDTLWLVNDKKVTEDSVDILESSYIIVFE